MSDADGERILRPLDRFDPHERGGIGRPGTFVVAPDGRIAHENRGGDYADRAPEDEIVAALERLEVPPLDPPPPWRPDAEPEEHPDAFRTDAFGPYFRGVRSGALALARRLGDSQSAAARRLAAMASEYLEAWKTRRESFAR